MKRQGMSRRSSARRAGALGGDSSASPFSSSSLSASLPLPLVQVGGGDHRGATTSATSLPKDAPSVDTRAFAHEGLLAFASGGALYVLDGTKGTLREVGLERSGAEEPSFSHDGRFLAHIAAGRVTSITDFGPQAPFAPVPGPLVLARANGSAA